MWRLSRRLSGSMRYARRHERSDTCSIVRGDGREIVYVDLIHGNARLDPVPLAKDVLARNRTPVRDPDEPKYETLP